jgi:DNA-binding MarR family transcriptional regulator
MTPRRRTAPLDRDAADLFEASTEFIRVYQFRDRDHALKYGGLTVVQAYALAGLVARGAHTLNALAQELQLDKSTTSRVVAGMSQRGLIEWSRPDHDRRAKHIVASTEGRRRYEHLRRALVRNNARLLASYSAMERRAAIAVLRQLAQIARARRSVPRTGPRRKRSPRMLSRGA